MIRKALIAAVAVTVAVTLPVYAQQPKAAPKATPATDCHQSIIKSPSPFMGNNDEIFELADGSIWKIKYEYSYLYEYYPIVDICPGIRKLIIKGKSLNVENLSKPNPNPNPNQIIGDRSGSSESQTKISPSQDVIETRIDGTFNGWDGETVYKMSNGQIWQQASYHYHYHYAYSPKVLIYRSGSGYKIKVDGDSDSDVSVKRLK